MSNVQSDWTRQGRCSSSSTREEHSSCRDGSTSSNLVRDVTPFPQEALHGDQSVHSETLNHPSLAVIVKLQKKSVPRHMQTKFEPRTLQTGSGCSLLSNWQAGSIHFSFLTSDTSGHRLRPRRSRNLLVRIFTPIPHVLEQTDHSLHSVVSQSGSLLGEEITSSSFSSSFLNKRKDFPEFSDRVDLHKKIIRKNAHSRDL